MMAIHNVSKLHIVAAGDSRQWWIIDDRIYNKVSFKMLMMPIWC